MADYTYSRVTKSWHEWLVPNGSPVAEFGKAYSAAQLTYEDENGEKPSWDDWATVHATDEGIVIRLEVAPGGPK